MNRFFYVADDHDYRDHFEPSLGTITNQKADELIESGKSFLGPPLEISRYKLGSQALRRVSNPTWHSPSWLRLDEIHESLAHFDYPLSKATPEVQTAFSAMATLDTHHGKGHSRLVFWFDN
ncbi:MAG: hypothetical protein NXI04_29625 [Planctomycetaceae bacterium]|nr:hypothetical protein [Planctomycetaceae bacterium]